MAIVRPNIYDAGAYIGDPLAEEKRKRADSRAENVNRVTQALTQGWLRQQAIDSSIAKQKAMYQELLGQEGQAAAAAVPDEVLGAEFLAPNLPAMLGDTAPNTPEGWDARAAVQALQSSNANGIPGTLGYEPSPEQYAAGQQAAAAQAAVMASIGAPTSRQIEVPVMTPSVPDAQVPPAAPQGRNMRPPERRQIPLSPGQAPSNAESQANADRIAAIRQAINSQKYGWLDRFAEEYHGY